VLIPDKLGLSKLQYYFQAGSFLRILWMEETLMSLNPADFGTWIKRSEIPEEDPVEDTDERWKRVSMAEPWRERANEFDGLRQLAFSLGVSRVIVAKEAPINFEGWYSQDDLSSAWASQWGLSDRQRQSINRGLDKGPAILISYYADDPCSLLSHELGHFLEDLASIAESEKNLPPTKSQLRFFPNRQVDSCRSEINAEALAEYLTEPTLRATVRRHAESILNRLESRDAKAYDLVWRYRKSMEKVKQSAF
jgi:hypothetical protein